ncbi:MAG: regulatory protein GemA [Defluviitaleaceae bacterium]|nr:regulatory protein GemA [Defluviitaleaceae bacterium]
MSAMSDAQRRKIFKLKAEHGLDDDTLRAYIHSLVGKSGLKELTMREAIQVIDALAGTKANAPGRISCKQQKYLEGLAKQYGWVSEDGEPDMQRLNGWLEKRYKVSSVLWLTQRNASDAIEGLKAMIDRERRHEPQEPPHHTPQAGG